MHNNFTNLLGRFAEQQNTGRMPLLLNLQNTTKRFSPALLSLAPQAKLLSKNQQKGWQSCILNELCNVGKWKWHYLLLMLVSIVVFVSRCARLVRYPRGTKFMSSTPINVMNVKVISTSLNALSLAQWIVSWMLMVKNFVYSSEEKQCSCRSILIASIL